MSAGLMQPIVAEDLGRLIGGAVPRDECLGTNIGCNGLGNVRPELNPPARFEHERNPLRRPGRLVPLSDEVIDPGADRFGFVPTPHLVGGLPRFLLGRKRLVLHKKLHQPRGLAVVEVVSPGDQVLDRSRREADELFVLGRELRLHPRGQGAGQRPVDGHALVVGLLSRLGEGFGQRRAGCVDRAHARLDLPSHPLERFDSAPVLCRDFVCRESSPINDQFVDLALKTLAAA